MVTVNSKSPLNYCYFVYKGNCPCHIPCWTSHWKTQCGEPQCKWQALSFHIAHWNGMARQLCFYLFPLSAPWSAASPWTLTAPNTLSSHPTLTRHPLSNPSNKRRPQKPNIQKQPLLEKCSELLCLFFPWKKELFIFITLVKWNFKTFLPLVLVFSKLSQFNLEIFSKCRYFKR